MKITREKPCQRRHHRVNAPLLVQLNGQNLTATDWSLSGLCVEHYQGANIADNEQVNLLLELPFQGFQICFDIKAHVVRTTDNGHAIFVEFIELSERSFDLMNHFVDELIRGKMATVDDTICRIDVPVTPISTSPTPNPSNQVPLRRWPIKTILMSGVYLLLGLFVFSYIGLLFYSSYFTLEVPHSVISSKIQILKMPIDGVLRPIHFNVGTKITKGEVIFSIENTALSSKINAVEVKIKKTESELVEAKEKYRIENERMKLYQIVSQTDTKILQAQLASKKVELHAADNNVIRLLTLQKSNAVTDKQIDQAKEQQSKLVYQLKAIEAKHAQAQAMESVSDRRHYNHKVFATDLDISTVELQKNYAQLQIEKQQLQYLRNSQNSQVVRAPYDGQITNIYHSADTAVPKNEPILEFEQTNLITVNAYLNQEEILQIGLHDLARVYLPALNTDFNAVVIKIDRRSAYIDQKTNQYSWKNSKEKTAIVSLEIIIDEQSKPFLHAGLPAVVIFNRRNTSHFFSKILKFSQKKSMSEFKKASNGGHYDSI